VYPADTNRFLKKDFLNWLVSGWGLSFVSGIKVSIVVLVVHEICSSANDLDTGIYTNGAKLLTFLFRNLSVKFCCVNEEVSAMLIKSA
jgi:hypothetical protein